MAESSAESIEPIEPVEPTETKPEPAETKPEPADEPTAPDDQPNALHRAWHWLRAKTWRLPVIGGGAALVLAAAVITLVPSLRYPVYGLVIYPHVQVKVTDAFTHQPLPKALVEIGGQGQYTNAQGLADFPHAVAGHATVKVTKAAYDASSQSQTIALLHATTLNVALKSNGIKVIVQVKNAISQTPIAGATATIGDADAVSNADGQAELSLPPSLNNTTQTLKLTKLGFNDAQLTARVIVSTKPLAATLVPAGKVYFLSNRSGHIDLYSSDLDGNNSKVVLPGTGNEDSATGLLPSVQHSDLVALVSSRDGTRDYYGNLIHNLYLFNGKTGALSKIDDHVEFNNFRAWIGDDLIYERYVADYGACPNIRSFDAIALKNSSLVPPDNANCPHVIAALANGFIYSINTSAVERRGIYYQALTGGGSKKVSDIPSNSVAREVRNTLLSEYYNNSPAPPYNSWQSINLTSLTATNLSTPPTDTGNYGFIDSPGGLYTTFIDERDGQKNLYLLDSNGANERKLTNLGSVNQFVQWFGDDYIVFSSTKSNENALYVVAVAGGQPVKISDFYRGNERTYGGGYNPAY